MSAPFVTQLRSRPGVLRLGADGAERITVRVEMPELWDTVRVEAPADEPVAGLKAAAISALYPAGEPLDGFVVKLNGWEVLDESQSITAVGGKAGSTFLITHRRRRPVR